MILGLARGVSGEDDLSAVTALAMLLSGELPHDPQPVGFAVICVWAKLFLLVGLEPRNPSTRLSRWSSSSDHEPYQSRWTDDPRRG